MTDRDTATIEIDGAELAWDSVIGPRPPPPPAPEMATDAELALVGAVVIGQELAALVDVAAADFSDRRLRNVWAVMQRMAADSETIDPLTVSAAVDPKTCPGVTVDYLCRLDGTRATWIAWESEAAAVKNAAARRRLAAIADRLGREAADGAVAPEAIIASLHEHLTRASSHDTARILSLVDLAERAIDPQETLLGSGPCRYLERGAVAMLAAPSGVGKSHLAAQAAVCWACGSPAFGLPVYSRALRILTVQAENPPNDESAIAARMLVGLDLTAGQRDLVHANTRQVWLPGCTGSTFLARLRSILSAWPADVVFIDPLAGFADGDLTKPETVQAFCRGGLSSLAVRHKCGLFVCHHVPKPNANRDASRQGAYDCQYAGAGSADLVANWPRAVLVLTVVARGEFVLRAAKRTPPWTTGDGRQAWELALAHTDVGTWQVCEMLDNRNPDGEAPDQTSYRDVIVRLVAVAPRAKMALREAIKAELGIGTDKATAAMDDLLADGSLVAWKLKKQGTPTMIGLPSQSPENSSSPGSSPTSGR